MIKWAVFAEGIEADLLAGLDSDTRRLKAVQAINRITREARNLAADQIRSEIAFPDNYVSGKRLYVSKKAQRSSLEGRITARGRATSLARFVKGGVRKGQKGVLLEVGKGKAQFQKRLFVLPLRQGSEFTDTKYNLGLAIRLRAGERLDNKLSARKVESGLYLLYGPSVYQVFRGNDGEGVANDIGPEVAARLEREFLRLLDFK